MAKPVRVALFATCLVDLMRPSVGFAAAKLLEQAGCEVTVPAQTCCGQPAYNAGDRETATQVAKATIEALEPYDYVVVPSGSCGGMIAKHYPDLLAETQSHKARAEAVAAKTFELSVFLTEIKPLPPQGVKFARKAAYHDSCSSRREMKIHAEPRALLAAVEGLELREIDDAESCCGFGGLFSVKYPDISNKMVAQKALKTKQSGAEVLLAGDLGCLMNIAGKLSRQGDEIEAYHYAEVLAGMAGGPAIGKS